MGGFFGNQYIELGKPCLWIFDCRRGGSGAEDEACSHEDYCKVFEQLKNWMSFLLRWNAIFLFPAGIYFDEEMRSKMCLPERCHWLHGLWLFKAQTVTSYTHDLRHGEQKVRGVQAVGNVGIIMYYPVEGGPLENLPRSMDELPVVFEDSWNGDVLPRVEDKFERTPRELKRLVHMYLPRNWGLVTLGITMAVPTILEAGFAGNEVMIMESASIRTQFVYSLLQRMYGDKMMMVNNVSVAAERRSSPVPITTQESPNGSPLQAGTSVLPSELQNAVRSSIESSDEEDRFQVRDRRNVKGRNVVFDSEASSSSNSGSNLERTHSDDIGSGGHDLGSSDIDAFSDAHEEQMDQMEMEEDPDYVPKNNVNDVENVDLEDVEANVEGIGGTHVGPEPMSALSAFSILESMSLTADADGYFYNNEGLRYKQTDAPDRYKFYLVPSILEGSSVSPTLSEGVPTVGADLSMPSTVQGDTLPSAVLAIGRTSSHEEVEIGEVGEAIDIAPSCEQVLETPTEEVQ